MLEGLKARLEELLRDAGRDDPRDRAARLREALIEGRAGLAAMRDALSATERELAAERRQLADAERRGRLAAELPDPETVRVAQRFAARHGERVAVLERKLAVQRDELALAEREIAELGTEFRAARTGTDTRPRGEADPGLEAEVEPGPAEDGDLRRRAEAVEAQLAYLKKKLGRE